MTIGSTGSHTLHEQIDWFAEDVSGIRDKFEKKKWCLAERDREDNRQALGEDLEVSIAADEKASADVEMFETLAGIDKVRSSPQHAAAVYWVIISPLSKPDSLARNGGKSLNVSRADSIHSILRSAIPAMWQSAMRSSSIAIASGMP